jgi:acetyl-CoA C-acetyltransferase
MAENAKPRPNVKPATRQAAIVGGNRIPFARSNSKYAHASNQDMLTATLDGLVARFGLQGKQVGEVVAGAVLKHSRDFNLTREAVLGSKLAATTPAYDVQQACGTGLQAVIRSSPASPVASTRRPTRRSPWATTCAGS